MQLLIDHKVIVETTGGYSHSVNGKVERPHQNINNMVRIQLLSRWHIDELWCFWYQYTIWIIYRLIKRCLVSATIVACYKNKNISYTIPFTHLVIWGSSTKSNKRRHVTHTPTWILVPTPLPYNLTLHLKLQMYSSWDIPVTPPLLYTLTLKPV